MTSRKPHGVHARAHDHRGRPRAARCCSPAGAEMGHHLGRFGAGPLPDRQSVGAARSEIRLPGSSDRRPRPDVPPHRAARHFWPARAPALLQCVWYKTPDHRRRPCGTASWRPCLDAWYQHADEFRRQAEHHHRAGRVCLERPGRSAVRPRGHRVACRPQAGGELSYRRRQRPDDLARQGAHHVLCHRARCRRAGQGRGRGGLPVQHHLLVFSRRGRHGAPRRHPADRGVRGFHYRRDRLDAQRRGPLAQRAGAPAARSAWQRGRSGECRHRRQPDHRSRRLLPAKTVSRRAVGARPAGARCARPVGGVDGDLARGDQQLQPQRQCQPRGRPGRDARGRGPPARKTSRACG